MLLIFFAVFDIDLAQNDRDIVISSKQDTAKEKPIGYFKFLKIRAGNLNAKI